MFADELNERGFVLPRFKYKKKINSPLELITKII